MEGRDRPHPLDLVNMAARLRQGLAEKRLGWAIAEQQQPPGLGEPDMLPRDLRACLSLGR